MPDDHLSPDALASLAVTGADEPAHVSSCPECRTDLASLREVIGDLRSLPDPPAVLIEKATSYFRRRQILDDLIRRMIEEPALREQARTRPEKVLREAGLEPDAELIAALREIDRPSGDLARRFAAKTLWY
jgi:hypothetical protein